MILSEIADIDWFRAKRLPLREGRFRIREISLSDINPLTGIVEPMRAKFTGFDGNFLRKNCLEHGDILISFNIGRPLQGICGYVNGEIKAVPGAEFCRVRPCRSHVRPFGLFFWLKLKAIPEVLLRMASKRKERNRAASINLQLISEIEVDLPEIGRITELAIGFFNERRRHAEAVRSIFETMKNEIGAEHLETPEEHLEASGEKAELPADDEEAMIDG